jgi:hypothetical protein
MTHYHLVTRVVPSVFIRMIEGRAERGPEVIVSGGFGRGQLATLFARHQKVSHAKGGPQKYCQRHSADDPDERFVASQHRIKLRGHLADKHDSNAAGTGWTCPDLVDTWVNLPVLPVRADTRTLWG